MTWIDPQMVTQDSQKGHLEEPGGDSFHSWFGEGIANQVCDIGVCCNFLGCQRTKVCHIDIHCFFFLVPY